MNWDDVRVFLAIARSGSVRGAGAAMDVSHSTVLRRLDGLEEALGVALFHRLPSGYELTSDGIALFPKAETIELNTIAFQREATGHDRGPRGKITLTMPEPVAIHYLAPRLVEFREEHPGIELEIIFTYDVLDLARRAADVAIRFSSAPDESLIGRQLPRFEDAYYATPKYLADHPPDDQSSGARWLGWRDNMQWVASSPYPHLPVEWRIPNVSVQLAMCQAGFGLAQLPCFIGDRCNDLVRLPGTGLATGFSVWVLYHPDLKATARIQILTKFLVRVITEDADLFEGRLPRYLSDE